MKCSDRSFQSLVERWVKKPQLERRLETKYDVICYFSEKLKEYFLYNLLLAKKARSLYDDNSDKGTVSLQ